MKSISGLLLRLIAAAVLTAAAGCRHTVNGVGQDVENAGHTIHRAVN